RARDGASVGRLWQRLDGGAPDPRVERRAQAPEGRSVAIRDSTDKCLDHLPLPDAFHEDGRATRDRSGDRRTAYRPATQLTAISMRFTRTVPLRKGRGFRRVVCYVPRQSLGVGKSDKTLPGPVKSTVD